jgi:hypothetical protein
MMKPFYGWNNATDWAEWYITLGHPHRFVADLRRFGGTQGADAFSGD